MNKSILGLALVSSVVMLSACDVKKTQEGNVTVPKYEVEQTKQGDVTLPKYEVTPPEVTVGTETKTITVPTVKTEEKTIEVPTVKVTPAPDK